MSHKHWPKGTPRYEEAPVCPFRTVKECDIAYADWQADRQVDLAQRVAESGDVAVRRYSKDSSIFGQLVNVLANRREDIEGTAAFTGRLRAALARHRVVEEELY